ncbi:MAG: aminoacyl-tRNA hydrolase [Bacteroidaceae bacterium]|nr:aminoacyl-tRNA hydrolase [Bacteroidaceae bacterium]MBR4779316.1 aminoacyl-tRNA hydrolase [Bacteroidaceae bacterium]
MTKYLIVGLGNPGDEYKDTRHNVGYNVLDAFAEASNTVFEDRRYGYVAYTSVKNCQLVLLKPTTFMNLSGNAVRYWLNKENIAGEHLLVVVDDLSLPVGTLRLKGKGGAGGHNGLRHIEQVLCSQQYARLRVGIGNGFPPGAQVDFVLSSFDADDRAVIDAQLPTAIDIIKSFCLAGLDITMNQYNGRSSERHEKSL